jgi:hypothetical protein
MRYFILVIAILFIFGSVFGSVTTIYNIQYTTVAGTGSTFPSTLVNQVVTTEGIVTGVGYTGGKYVISEGAGAWKGIFVNDPSHSPQIGDKVAITGTVNEVSGFTEIGYVTSYSVISSDNAIPSATPVTTYDLQGYPNYLGEAYEGVLVKLSNVKVTLVSGNVFYVQPVSGSTTASQILNGFFAQPHTWSGVVVSQVWSELTGIVNYSSPTPPQYRLNPRSDSDMVPLADINTVSMKIDNVEAKKGETKSVNVNISKTEADWNLTKYGIKVGFNKRILSFVDVDLSSTLSTSEPTITLSANEDSVTISYNGSSPIVSPSNNGLLIKLLFKTLSYGESVLDLTQGKLNDSINVSILTDGKITIPIKKKTAWLSVWKDNLNKKNIFDPWLNQKITIEYGCLIQPGIASSKAIIRIYDVQGRLVATPINQTINATDGIEYLQWDGRDRNKNLLPIGVYYCHLEIIDRVTGESETAVQPIVIASKLK